MDFRVEGWLVALIVSEPVKEAMEQIGCFGAKFVEVTQGDARPTCRTAVRP